MSLQRSKLKLGALLALFLWASRDASAQLPDVAIVAAATSSITDCRFTDPQAKLISTGRFGTVDVISTAAATPSLTALMAYDAVICWTNTSPVDNNAWGDVMADYVDAGGGVVVAVFANSSTNTQRRLGGRWQSQPGYEVIVPASGSEGSAATLGNVLVPGHPLMAGVSSLSASSAFRPSVSAVTPGSTIIAEWSDGRILAATGANPKRIDLGLYPPSSDCSGAFWDSNTDGLDLLLNALLGVANAPSPQTEMLIRGDCNNDASFNLTDAVFLLNYLFPQGAPVALDCPDACDATDDGSLNLPDAVAILNALFGMPPVPIVGPSSCDVDPTMDMLDCPDSTACP